MRVITQAIAARPVLKMSRPAPEHFYANVCSSALRSDNRQPVQTNDDDTKSKMREKEDNDELVHKKKLDRKQEADKKLVHEQMQTTRERDLAKMRAIGMIEKDQPEKDIDRPIKDKTKDDYGHF